MAQTVAFISLGIMGQGMSRRLLKAGYQIKVYNRTREKAEVLAKEQGGVTVAETPAEATDGADFVVLMPDNDATLKVVTEGSDGILAKVGPHTTVMQMATINPETTRTLGQAVEAKGGSYLDAPVFGSKNEAANGELWIPCGGTQEVYDHCLPLLKAMAQYQDLFGPVGAGASMKLCGNLLVGQMVTGLAQSLTLGRKAGLDVNQMLALLAEVDFKSPIYDGVGKQMAEHTFPTSFSVRNMLKDVNLVVDFGHAQGVPVPGPESGVALFEQAIDAGHGEENVSAVVTVLERSAGL